MWQSYCACQCNAIVRVNCRECNASRVPGIGACTGGCGCEAMGVVLCTVPAAHVNKSVSICRADTAQRFNHASFSGQIVCCLAKHSWGQGGSQ